MDSVDRILLLLRIEGVSRPELAEKTNMKKERWQNVLKRQAKIYQEDIEAISTVWPEYEVWLSTGREYPDDGQISPLTKKEAELLKPARQAGE